MSARTADEYGIITAAVTKACADAGVRDGSAVNQHLVHDAEVHDLVDVYTPSMVDGRSISLEQRLVEMKADPRWSREFNVAERKPVGGRPTATPPGSILTPDRDAFKKIVEGTARVE